MGGPGSLAAFAAALMPVVVLAIWLWLVDRGRTSSDLVGQALTLGALVVPAVLLPEWLFDLSFAGTAADLGLNEFGRDLIGAAVSAPLLEEAGRFCVLVFVLARHEDFRPASFVVVAGWLSLGLAGIENAGYLVMEEEWSVRAVLRATTAVPNHLVLGVVMGAFLAAHASTRRRVYLLLAYAVPVGLHGFYNASAIIAAHAEGAVRAAAFLAVLMALTITLMMALRPMLREERAAFVLSRRARLAGLVLGWSLVAGSAANVGAVAFMEFWPDEAFWRRPLLAIGPAILPAAFGFAALHASRRTSDCPA